MPRALSLHIGLNSVDPAAYDGWSGPLVACEADARSMASLCDKAGFDAHTLMTEDATREAVRNAILDVAKSIGDGDIFVVSYSGHGGQLPDLYGDEVDALDETWCLFDGQFLDDELYRLWAEFPVGARIVVFSDSCHSGTVIKNALLAGRLDSLCSTGLLSRSPGSPRVMPPQITLRAYEAHRQAYDELLKAPPPPEPTCTVVLISGCQDNQLSMDGPFNGAFTGALLSTWAGGAFTGSYEALTKAVRSKLPPSQSPNYMVAGRANSAFTGGQALSI